MKNKLVSHLVLTGLFVVLVLAASNSIVRAQDCPSTTWIYSGRTSDWFSPGNWSNCIPNATNDAYINNGGIAQIHGSNVFAETQSLTLGDNQGDSGGVTVYDSAILKISCVTGSCPGPIYIGNQGSGSLSIGSGGLVISKYGYIAGAANSNGTVTVPYGTVWLLMDTPYPPFNNFGAGIFVGCTATSNGVGGTATVSVGGTIEVHNRPDAPYNGAAGVVLGLSGYVDG